MRRLHVANEGFEKLRAMGQSDLSGLQKHRDSAMLNLPSTFQASEMVTMQNVFEKRGSENFQGNVQAIKNLGAAVLKGGDLPNAPSDEDLAIL